ncbi:MAG: Panacea domain-containing protein [Actinomycetota bacterium]
MPIEDDLLWYLTWRVSHEEGVPAKTRLVKLIYLVDLMNVRDQGEQVTSLRWIFYHYGPWAPEIEDVIGRQIGNTIDTTGSRDFFGERMFVYRVQSWPPDTLLEDRIRRYCDLVCQQWAVEDLNDLLSYVYFETPPMVGAVRGESLDLNRVRSVEWPPWYKPLQPPELDERWTGRRADWHRQFDEAFPMATLSRAPRRDEEHERANATVDQPESDLNDTPVRGRLVVDSGFDEA